jgi:phage/plasmid-like protein (TIGR03299 family)
MSAELSYTNGKADFFAVGETAWHREGTTFEAGTILTLEQALAAAKLDYLVEKRSLAINAPDGSNWENGPTSKKAFLTYRADRGVELGRVGPDYTVVQNRDAFEMTIGALLERGVLRLETGGVLREGADAWLLGQFNLTEFGPEARSVFGQEGVAPYAFVRVNHSGSRNNEIALTPVRVVCANTLGMVERQIDGAHGIRNAEGDEESSQAIGVRHTKNAGERMQAAANKLFSDLVGRAELVAKQYRKLRTAKLATGAEFRALAILPTLGAHPTRRKRWNPEARQADTVVARYEEKGAEILRLWTEGKGHTGDGSAWEAYNGVVEAIDHNETLFPMRGGVYRTQGLLDGKLRDMKRAALSELVLYADAIEQANEEDDRSALDDILAETDRRAALTTAA